MSSGKIKAELSLLNSQGLYVTVSFGSSPPRLIRIHHQTALDQLLPQTPSSSPAQRVDITRWRDGRMKEMNGFNGWMSSTGDSVNMGICWSLCMCVFVCASVIGCVCVSGLRELVCIYTTTLKSFTSTPPAL